MNIITPLILIIISLAIFFGYVDPNYRGTDLGADNRSIQSLLAEDGQYQEALNNTITIRDKRTKLQDKINSLNPDSLAKLEKLLPDNIDNIKLVIDMNNVAKIRGLSLKNIKLDTALKAEPDRLGADNNKYATVGLSFSVNASYDNFQNFLHDLEQSLRLVDISDLSVTANNSGLYEFSVSLKTYWLK